MPGSSDYSLYPEPRPMSRRGWIVLGCVTALVLVLVVLVLRFYDAEGGSTVSGGLGASATPGLVATISPSAVDSVADEATMHVAMGWQGPGIVGDDGRVLDNTRVIVVSALGTKEVIYLAGETIGEFDVIVGLDGEEANYPFDPHAGAVEIAADTFEIGSDGTIRSTRALPIGLVGLGGVNGWNTTMALAADMTDRSLATVTFDRAFSTRVFALLLLALSVLVALSALIAGVLVSTNRRRLEVTMLSWGAALLFALPLMRNYLPNSPPVGAAIDIYVFLWTMVMAVVALMLMVYAWIAQKRAELLDERQRRDAATDPGEPAR